MNDNNPRPSDRAIAEAFAELLRAYEADPPNPGTVDYGGVFALNAIRNRAAELDASGQGEVEPAWFECIIHWPAQPGEYGRDAEDESMFYRSKPTDEQLRGLPPTTVRPLYTRPPVASAPGFVLVPQLAINHPPLIHWLTRHLDSDDEYAQQWWEKLLRAAAPAAAQENAP